MGLPEALQRKLFQKLKFEDYDFAEYVKIIIDEKTETTEVVAQKELKAESNVFLVDHAWTFKYEDAYKTLHANEALFNRLDKLTESGLEKGELSAVATEEETKVESLEDLFARYEETKEANYELADRKIPSIKALPNQGVFPEYVETIDLMDNEIRDPNEVANNLVELPNLKALWLNRCPVVDACSNFEKIADLMPALEIINSQFTAKSGEWAIKFYGREGGAQTLEDIVNLDLSGKKIMHMKSAEVFGKLTNLKKLDISDHEEFFMSEEAKEKEEFNALLGI